MNDQNPQQENAPHGFDEKAYFDHAWEHFKIIADQRLKTFNFYIILLAATVAATASVLDKTSNFAVLILCGFIHIFVARIFSIIEKRSNNLITIPRDVLLKMEMQHKWDLFSEDERRKQNRDYLKISYRRAFRMTFAGQTFFGILVIVFALYSNCLSRPPTHKVEPAIAHPNSMENVTGSNLPTQNPNLVTNVPTAN